MHFPAFSTNCGTNASHLELTKYGGGESYSQEPWTDTFDAITHGCTPPLSSRGPCKPTNEYPYCTQSCCLLLTHPQIMGATIQLLAVVNTSTSTSVCVCVCACVRACVCVCVCVCMCACVMCMTRNSTSRVLQLTQLVEFLIISHFYLATQRYSKLTS